MPLVDLVLALALLQFAAFGILVGRARGKYGVKAPATSGHDMFDRYFRVQMNTLEVLVLLIPGLLMAPRYLAPHWVAAIGAVYLLGRIVYLRAYISDPASRGIGFGLSFFPAMVLLLIALGGSIRSLVQG
ncbi:MAG: MAPEG family protein [Panacagrimonas sp.]